MIGVKAAKKFEQPKTFEFTNENLKIIDKLLAKYPEGRQQSAVLPLLQLAQEQHNNWLPRAAMTKVAAILSMPEIRVYEVATFYTMFNLEPVGKYFIQLCGTTPCWLRGADEITKVCKEKLGIVSGETTQDEMFSLLEVECLGACANAPMVQINDDYYEDLNADNFTKLLDDLANDRPVKIGSQIGRLNSMPEGGKTTLKEGV